VDSDRRPTRCLHWIGAQRQYCLAKDGLRRYLIGVRCPLHTPAALAGEPEPRSGPGLPAGAWTTPSPQAASALVDERAVASGKRRAPAHVYRAAVKAQRPPRE
jgi:hypothetical protein